MKITLDLPRDSEVQSFTYDPAKRQIVIEPIFLRKQRTTPLCYVTAEGRSGAVKRSIIRMHGATGLPGVRPLDSSTDTPFDQFGRGGPPDTEPNEKGLLPPPPEPIGGDTTSRRVR